MRTIVTAVLVASTAAASQAGVPEYEGFDLAMRANFSGAFNVPNSLFPSNTTPSLNDSGGVAVSLSGGAEGVWYDGSIDGTGGVVPYTTGGFLSDVSLNNNEKVVVEQFFASPETVILIDGANGSSGPAFATSLFSGYSSPQINDSDLIAFRGATGAGDQFFATDVIGGGLNATIYVAEVGVEPASPYSFLFTPSFNNNDQIAGKARRGASPSDFGESNPDEIRIWNSDGASTLIAEDADADPTSPYAAFDNSVSLTDNGWVAFTANLVAGGRGVFLSDGETTIEIATEADADVSEIEFFQPAANDAGLVAFRAFNGLNRRAVFVGDGDTLTQIAADQGLVEIDLGTARIGQETPTSPAFGGGPSINADGDVAFLAGVQPPDNTQIEWGTALLIARAADANPADLDGDGIVGSSDLGILIAAWGPCDGPCPEDLDGDGTVGSSDLGALIAAWG